MAAPTCCVWCRVRSFAAGGYGLNDILVGQTGSIANFFFGFFERRRKFLIQGLLRRVRRWECPVDQGGKPPKPIGIEGFPGRDEAPIRDSGQPGDGNVPSQPA